MKAMSSPPVFTSTSLAPKYTSTFYIFKNVVKACGLISCCVFFSLLMSSSCTGGLLGVARTYHQGFNIYDGGGVLLATATQPDTTPFFFLLLAT